MLPASELLITNVSQTDPDFASIFPDAQPAGKQGGFSLYRTGDLWLGLASRSIRGDLESAGRQIYRDLFAATEGWQLYRVWNQVPAINSAGPGGLENYRAFSAGRSRAFEERFGLGFCGQLPAASGVGTKLPDLTVAFVAGVQPARHFENPHQLPAYQYPAEHGPRSPSFARASAAQWEGKKLIFISGTAAIKGHRTMSPFELKGQLACTLDNLSLIGAASGVGADLGASARWHRFFKVYHRFPEDRAVIAAALETSLLRPGDEVVWRETDLCRVDLLVEIEATLVEA